ncbi:MAG: dynamin family protein [Nannocystaceae bacterium]
MNATLTQTLGPISSRLAEIARALGLDAIADTIAHDTARRLSQDVVRVLVLGEIKQGKSSLINALLGPGHDALPMGVTPTTGATVIVRCAEPTGRFLVARDGSTSELAPEPFAAYAKGTPPADAPTGVLELRVAPGVLPEGLELVDTPGINDIANWRATISRGELPSADVLLLVLDATQLLHRTELALLRDALAAVGGLVDSGARLLLAINRIDLVAPEERPQLRAYLERELASLLQGGLASHDVFETEARGALREPGADRAGVHEVARLRAVLQQVASTRREVLPTRVRASLLRSTSLLSHNAAIAAHALGLEQEALRRELRALEREWAATELDMTAVRETMAASRKRLLDASDDRITTFRSQLQASTLTAVGTASQRVLAAHLPAALHDAVVGFAREEGDRLRAELDELTHAALHTHSEQTRRLLALLTLRLGFHGPTIYLDPPSIALEAGMIAIGLVGTAVMYFGNVVAGMVMTVAGPLATVVLRERSLRDARARVRAELPAALDRASEALRDAVVRAVDAHVAALDEHLVLANRAIGEQLAAVLRRAQASLTIDDAPSTAELVASRRTRAQQQLRELELELVAVAGQLRGLSSTEATDDETGAAAAAG